jgi:hypothetical protein
LWRQAVEDEASVRQDIGCYTPMQLPPGGLVMIITPEQAALKAQERFGPLLGLGRQASHEGQRIDTAERDLMRQLLALGHDLLAPFIANQGDGDLGPNVEAPEGRTLHRLPQSHVRRYVSIFGGFTIPRVVYGTREGRKIEHVPRDQRLGWPEGDFSYVLGDWGPRSCLKEPFAEAGRSLEMLLGLDLGRRTLEQMNRAVAGDAPAFRAAIEPPSPEEEGPLLVVTADGKGVPMRKPGPDGPRPHHRPTEGEKRNKEQMACVGAVSTIKPVVRTADAILDEVMRPERARDRPRPQHKHAWAEMIREVEGEPPVTAKDGLFGQWHDDLVIRNLGQDRPVICLRDGERSRWDAPGAFFPEAVGVLDLFHVLERVWGVAHCAHEEGRDEAEAYVEERLRELLEGRVGAVIEAFRRCISRQHLRGNRRQVVKSAIEYLENNREHLRYDEYLAAGYPIGSGVAEGACRHPVKDRLEQTGMRWTVTGAQAMRHVRALDLNDQWEEYLEFRVEQEQARLYQGIAA